MKDLAEDIKRREFKNAYLLYGEETYLKRQYKKKLEQAISGGEDTMNLNRYAGRDIDVQAVIDQADTLPFFADYRLIVIEDSRFFKSANEQMARYLKQIPRETIFLFVEDEVDKRNKLYKAVKNVGRAVEFARQDEKTLTKWILSLLKKEEKRITQQTMELFLEKTGNDMENIAAELEKLLCYTMGREVISEEDVAQITSDRTVNKIFEMIRAIAEKRQKEAFDLYYDLLALKEPPMRILFLISRQFHLLMQVKELERQGYDCRQIAEQTGLHSFIAKNYIRQAALFSAEELKQAVKDCVEAEESVKTGKMQDALSVELLIVKYSQKKAFD